MFARIVCSCFENCGLCDHVLSTSTWRKVKTFCRRLQWPRTWAALYCTHHQGSLVPMLLSIRLTEQMKLHITDVTKDFVKSKTVRHRQVNLHAPKEMELVKRKAVEVIQPVYGMSQSAMHWSKTYLDYEKQILFLTRTTMNPCLTYKNRKDELEGTIGISVDNLIFACTKAFSPEERLAPRVFRTMLELTSQKLTYNSIRGTWQLSAMVISK